MILTKNTKKYLKRPLPAYYLTKYPPNDQLYFIVFI